MAPGPVWTASFKETGDDETIRSFGQGVPPGHLAQAHEQAPAYLFLASEEADYITGQTFHAASGTPVVAEGTRRGPWATRGTDCPLRRWGPERDKRVQALASRVIILTLGERS